MLLVALDTKAPEHAVRYSAAMPSTSSSNFRASLAHLSHIRIVTAPAPLNHTSWSLPTRVAFRFAFVYLMLQIAPWTWFGNIPGLGVVLAPYDQLVDWAVGIANARVFHVRDTLVQPNGSGDASWAWAQLWLYLALAALATTIWSVVDRRRAAYPRAAYWLRTVARYYVASAALSYGIIKVFALQMVFPTYSNLATSLGDLLPMRLSWLFIGYSTPYQVYSGIMEMIAGMLMLWRRTMTLGLIVATAAFVNVAMINYAYDVPVKLYATHLLLACVFLLLQDAKRLTAMLVLNQSAGPTTLYDPPPAGVRFTWARRVVKGAMVVMFLVMPTISSWQRANVKPAVASPLAAGVYDVTRFVVRGDTLPAIVSDTVRWRDFIIDNASQGSVGSTDTLFWQRYRRGYFRYKADTARRQIAVWRTSFRQDSIPVFTARYEIVDGGKARLWTALRGDSVYVELTRSERHFQLAERQFHWISEYNR